MCFHLCADSNWPGTLKPSTKAPAGEKDENISPEEAKKIIGEKYAARIEELALKIYKAAHGYAVSCGESLLSLYL